MQSIISLVNGVLNAIAGLLGPLSGFTKAIVPAALALAVAVVDSLLSGRVDASAITIAATGLLGALVTFFLPNRSAAPVAPVKASRAKSSK